MNILSLIKNNFKDFLYILAIVGLIIAFLLKGCGDNKYENKYNSLKEKIIKKDSLLKVREGQYEKLVNNLNSQKDLNKRLKNVNKDLYNEIEKKEEKIVSLTEMVASFKNKTDTVNVYIDSVSNDTTFEDYYPNKEDWFAKYTGTLKNDYSKVVGKWSWGSLKFDLVITETEGGLWKQTIKGPDFIKIDSLTVNTLKPEDMTGNDDKTDRSFHGYAGGGGKYNINTESKHFLLKGGVGYKRNILLIGASSDEFISISYVREF